MSNLAADEYRCAKCHEVFKKGWTDEEAAAEKDALFPDVPQYLCIHLCDDCFRDVVPLCPVCGKPAPQRAWCSAECEAFDENGRDPD